MCPYKQCASVRATLRWYLQLTLDAGLGKSKYCTVSLFCLEDTQTNVSVAIVATCGGGEAAKYQPSHPDSFQPMKYFIRRFLLLLAVWDPAPARPSVQPVAATSESKLNMYLYFHHSGIHSTLQTGTRQLCSQHRNNIPQHADCRSEQAGDWRLPIANKQ